LSWASGEKFNACCNTAYQPSVIFPNAKPMKSICISAAIALCTLTAQAQDAATPQRFMFKMSPQHLIQTTLKVGGEFFLKTKPASITVFLQAASNNSSKEETYILFPYSGFGAEVGIRKYISPMQTITNRKGRQHTQGIYFSGFLQAGTYKGDYNFIAYDYDPQTQTSTQQQIIYSQSAQNMATGFTIGLQRIYWNILSLDVYVGAGYQLSNDEIKGDFPADFDLRFYKSSGIHDAGYTGVLPKGGLMLGIYLK
jgi:hypothetical protein